MEARRLPFDLDTLSLGSVITAADVERITGISQSLMEFGLARLNLINKIRDHLEAKLETDVAVIQHEGNIKVLTERERGLYEQRNAADAIKALNRTVRRMLTVDTKEMSDEEREEHERQIMRRTMQMQAAREADATFRKQLRERATPRMIGEVAT